MFCYWVKKSVRRVETHWLSNKVPGAVVNKESHADSVLGRKQIHHSQFLRKSCDYKQLPIPKFFHEIHFIYWMTLISIIYLQKNPK